jgi:hypothetical protein
MLYKYALLEGPKISNVWGSYHIFHLAHPILTKPVALQRKDIRELPNEISNPEGPNFGDTTKERSSIRTTSKSRFKRYISFLEICISFDYKIQLG